MLTKTKKKQWGAICLLIGINVLLFAAFLAFTLRGSPFEILVDIRHQPIGLPTVNYLPLILLVAINMIFLSVRGRGKDSRGLMVLSVTMNAVAKYVLMFVATSIAYYGLRLPDGANETTYYVLCLVLFVVADFGFFAYLRRIGVAVGKGYFVLAPLLYFLFGVVFNIYNLAVYSIGTISYVFENLVIAVVVGLAMWGVWVVYRKMVGKNTK